MNDEMGDILADIGRDVVDMVEYEPDGIILYAEGARAVMSHVIFKDMGDHVLYFFGTREIVHKLMDLWDAAEANKKWGALIYTISDGQFDARFEYPDEWIEGEHYVDRHNRFVATRFGNKKLVLVDDERDDGFGQ